METRKIQRVSSGTLTVSLPKEWAESEGVEAGTVVNVHPHLDGLLVIQASSCDGGDLDRVDVTIDHDDPDRLERSVWAAYTAGFNEVTLDAEDGFTDEQRRAVGRIARSLAGMTVVEETETKVTFRILLNSGDVSLRQSLRQLGFVTLSMHHQATVALTGDASTPPGDRDDQIDRLVALVDRHFNRALVRLDEIDALGLARPELFELRATAHELAGVADNAECIDAVAVDLAEATAESIADEFAELAQTVQTSVEDGVGVVLGDADVTRAHRVIASRDRVREDTEALERQLFETSASDYRLTHALDSLRSSVDHAANIAKLGLRSTLRRDDSTASYPREPDGFTASSSVDG